MNEFFLKKYPMIYTLFKVKACLLKPYFFTVQ